MSATKRSSKEKPSHDAQEKKTESLKTENQRLQNECKEKQEKLLRAYAELQNQQKRMEKESVRNEEAQKKKYLSEFLEVYETLQKAVQDANPKSGLQLLLQNMEKFLEKEQVKSLECTGKPFDPQYHDAICTIDKEGSSDGTVVEEIRKGYLLGERLLRPAQVVVAKKKETQHTEPKEA